jgi:murein L,D-transpeptidase YafK
MNPIFRLAALLATLALVACSAKPPVTRYDGPPVTLIEVHKGDRMMYLLHETTVLRSYKISLGYAPEGPKQFSGDGKTPEGAYLITHRNARSTYHLSLGISYPNEADRAYAEAQGKDPGNDIFIHGANTRGSSEGDWTVGCIAVTDREIEEIYAMVNPGTRINIFP